MSMVIPPAAVVRFSRVAIPNCSAPCRLLRNPMNLDETLLNARIVYDGKYLRTEERTVRLPDGREGRREIVVPPNAVGVLPIGDSGTVYLVPQYRTALGRTILEIPAGILEPGENPIDTARRECGEEIGLAPQRLDPLFGYYHSVGFSTGRIQVFLGRDLQPAPHAKPDGTEFTADPQSVTTDED